MGYKIIHPRAVETINRTTKVKVPESHNRFESTSFSEIPKPIRTNPTQMSKLISMRTNHHPVGITSFRKTNTTPVRKPEIRPNKTFV